MNGSISGSSCQPFDGWRDIRDISGGFAGLTVGDRERRSFVLRPGSHLYKERSVVRGSDSGLE